MRQYHPVFEDRKFPKMGWYFFRFDSIVEAVILLLETADDFGGRKNEPGIKGSVGT